MATLDKDSSSQALDSSHRTQWVASDRIPQEDLETPVKTHNQQVVVVSLVEWDPAKIMEVLAGLEQTIKINISKMHSEEEMPQVVLDRALVSVKIQVLDLEEWVNRAKVEDSVVPVEVYLVTKISSKTKAQVDSLVRTVHKDSKLVQQAHPLDRTTRIQGLAQLASNKMLKEVCLGNSRTLKAALASKVLEVVKEAKRAGPNGTVIKFKSRHSFTVMVTCLIPKLFNKKVKMQNQQCSTLSFTTSELKIAMLWYRIRC